MATFNNAFDSQLADAVRRKDRNAIKLLKASPGLSPDQIQQVTMIERDLDQPGTVIGGNTFGGNTFGGNTFGGQTFGGNTFGGNTFGASAPPPAPPPGPGQVGATPGPAGPAGPSLMDAFDPYLDPYNWSGGLRINNGGLDWEAPGMSSMMWDMYQNYVGKPFQNFVANSAQNFGYDVGTQDIPPMAGMSPEDMAAAAALEQAFPGPGMGPMGDLAGMAGPMQTGMGYSYNPIDYTQGFPQQAPQMPPPDFTAADSAFAEAAPQAPTSDPNAQILSWLGNAAAAAGQTNGNWGSTLAAAGGAGMLGLHGQRERERILQQEYEAEKRRYMLDKAQIMNARAQDRSRLEYENAFNSYEHTKALHELQLQTDLQMQPDVQLTAGGMVSRKFNPQTGQMDVTVVRDNDVAQYLQKRLIDRALGAGSGGLGILDLTPDKIDLDNLPVSTRPYALAATYLMDGIADGAAFGIDSASIFEKAQQEALEAGLTGEEASRVTRLNAFKYFLGMLQYSPQATASILSFPVGVMPGGSGISQQPPQ